MMTYISSVGPEVGTSGTDIARSVAHMTQMGKMVYQGRHSVFESGPAGQ